MQSKKHSKHTKHIRTENIRRRKSLPYRSSRSSAGRFREQHRNSVIYIKTRCRDVSAKRFYPVPGQRVFLKIFRLVRLFGPFLYYSLLDTRYSKRREQTFAELRAHCKLYHQVLPTTSHASPIKYNPGIFLLSKLDFSSLSITPPPLTFASSHGLNHFMSNSTTEFLASKWKKFINFLFKFSISKIILILLFVETIHESFQSLRVELKTTGPEIHR